MNIHELEKLATPGPFEPGVSWASVNGIASYIDAPGDDGRRVAQFLRHESADTLMRSMPPCDVEANTLLFCHCRNNFMEALAFLKAIGDCANETEAHDLIVNNLPDLLDKLEEVRV